MDRRPNILIVMTDQQRGDTVPPRARAVTPNLERLAADGITFTNTFCPSPHCCPSRGTFMTGLYPGRHGVLNNVCNDWALSRGLKSGVRCWSEDLNDAGYETGYAGKWHISVEEGPEDRGWRHLGHVSGRTADEHGAGWKRYDDIAAGSAPAARRDGMLLRPGWGHVQLYGSSMPGSGGLSHDEHVIGQGLELLDTLAAKKDPWCLFLGCVKPHDTYHAPPQYLDMYKPDDIVLPASYYDPMDGKPGIVRRMRRDIWGQLSRREVRETIRHYLALCTWLDDLFGKLMAALEAKGQAENTVVLYCSDHGDYMGDHGLFAKGIPCYRGAYHVPAVMRWPAGVAEPGSTVDAFVSLADFAPTFRELAGLRPDKNLAGRSLVPFLHGDRPGGWRNEIHTQCDGVELYYTQRSVMTEDFKYVFNGFDDDELYDLRRDTDEMVNQARNPQYEGVVRDMLGRIWRFAREQDDRAPNPYLTVALAPFGPGI